MPLQSGWIEVHCCIEERHGKPVNTACGPAGQVMCEILSVICSTHLLGAATL
jgi:hypothetical protein